MVEGRIYVQAPKRYHYEYFVLKRPTPVGKQERIVELSGQVSNTRPVHLQRREIPLHQTLEYLKRLRCSSVWVDGISHHNTPNPYPS